MVTRENAGVWHAHLWLPQIVERSWRSVGTLLAILPFSPQRRRIRVPDMSEEWLAQHACESSKHVEDG